MLQAYFDSGMHDEAVFECFVRRLPRERNFLVAAGLEEALEYPQTLSFSAGEIESLAATLGLDTHFLWGSAGRSMPPGQSPGAEAGSTYKLVSPAAPAATMVPVPVAVSRNSA